jgi:UDP-N-acetylmuramyl pentapeptide phosphotransferase/UDP-N-acetylglucosamine-1-phosphate transferase
MISIPPKYINSIGAAVISYFILIFLEDLLGINKKQRFFLAIAVGFLFYHYGEAIFQFIKNLFASIGL